MDYDITSCAKHGAMYGPKCMDCRHEAELGIEIENSQAGSDKRNAALSAFYRQPRQYDRIDLGTKRYFHFYYEEIMQILPFIALGAILVLGLIVISLW